MFFFIILCSFINSLSPQFMGGCYQYGVPMKDIRRARVAVICAEIPKSAEKRTKKKVFQQFIQKN